MLKQGADPLGGTGVSGWDVLEHVYDDIISYSEDYDSIFLPRMTRLFLDYGMNIDNPKVPYDDDNSIHPMWMMAFALNKNAFYTVKMLLDEGLSAESAAVMYNHLLSDFVDIDRPNPNGSQQEHEHCSWAILYTLLCASYDRVLKNDIHLQKFIGCSYNTYDLQKFRNPQNFFCEFDTSRCDQFPEFYKSVVHIIEKETGKEVWKIGIYLEEGEF